MDLGPPETLPVQGPITLLVDVVLVGKGLDGKTDPFPLQTKKVIYIGKKNGFGRGCFPPLFLGCGFFFNSLLLKTPSPYSRSPRYHQKPEFLGA